MVRNLLLRQFGDYVAAVRKADCAADLRRRLGKGPPVWIEDKHALPLPKGDTHVVRVPPPDYAPPASTPRHRPTHLPHLFPMRQVRVWFASDGAEYSAKLVGALEGEARQARAPPAPPPRHPPATHPPPSPASPPLQPYPARDETPMGTGRCTHLPLTRRDPTPTGTPLRPQTLWDELASFMPEGGAAEGAEEAEVEVEAHAAP